MTIRSTRRPKGTTGWSTTPAHNALVEGGYEIEKEDQFRSVTFTVAETAKGVYTCDRSVGGDFYLTAMGFTTLEDYNALTGENKTLAPGEVLSYASTGQTYTDVTVDSLSFTSKKTSPTSRSPPGTRPK